MTTAAKTAGARAVLAAGAAWWAEKLITVEWSYPYCNVRDDGPAGAVFGFPLPYEQASIVTSATHFFIPWLYLLNLCALATGIFFLLGPLHSRVGRLTAGKFLVGTAGAVLLVTAIAFEAMVLLAMDVWRPIPSFEGSPEYRQLRPVALRAFRRQADCTASPFWFGSQRDNRNPAMVGRDLTFGTQLKPRRKFFRGEGDEHGQFIRKPTLEKSKFLAPPICERSDDSASRIRSHLRRSVSYSLLHF